MKIIYVANARMPTEKAHGAQIMKTCEAFAQLGHDVELIVPDRNRNADIPEDPFIYYGIKTRFAIRRLRVWDTAAYGRVGFLLLSFLFALAVRRHLRSTSFDLLYGRDEFILTFLSVRYVWESHSGAWNLAARRAARHAEYVVVISNGLKDFYIAQGIPASQLVVAHDGIDLDPFAHMESRESARRRLGLPLDKKIAMYIGRIDGWKGVRTLLEASKLLPQEWIVAIIGGAPDEITSLASGYPDVRFLGRMPYVGIANNEAAADVLVLPNTGMNIISERYTSPLKLFAYMASNIPIVASDLPSIREVLDDHSAFLVRPDDASALASGIQISSKEGNTRAAQARADVAAFTWKCRAERILAVLPSSFSSQSE